MSTLNHPHGPGAAEDSTKPLWERYKPGHHWRSQSEEFDGVKLGFWLFLTTEVLLFGGIFCAYALFRLLHPEAWREGSMSLDWRWGGLNTVVLLISSYTMAASIYCFQTGQFSRARRNLEITFIAGLAFLVIKAVFEYLPKWSEGKRPGMLFDYPFAVDPHMPLWWSVYYCGTALHALHVIIGMALIARVWWRSRKGHYGPKYYTGVEIAGLYWHLVDLIWIFLFPLLYLIH
jgi:cytochrome c oxidase subunit 3